MKISYEVAGWFPKHLNVNSVFFGSLDDEFRITRASFDLLTKICPIAWGQTNYSGN